VSDRSAITNWTSRNTNAKNVSLPHCNADWMEDELTSSRTRATVAPSGRVWVGGRFCHSKFFAALMVHSITRSEFMRENRTCEGCRSIACRAKIRSNANAVVHQSFGGTSGLHWRSPSMAVEFYFTPELHLRDGRVIRDLEDAISFARMKADTGTGGLGRLLQTYMRATGSALWTAAKEQLEKLHRQKAKRAPSERHKQRMNALYVDPIPGGWNRPTMKISQAVASDYLQEALNDYRGQYDRYTNPEIYKPDDPDFYSALAQWTGRPTLAQPENP
jgi:hypothetical protein